MEIKKSVVTVTSSNGTWEGKYGLMYKFIIEFENGDRGSYLSKSETQNKFVIGNEILKLNLIMLIQCQTLILLIKALKQEMKLDLVLHLKEL